MKPVFSHSWDLSPQEAIKLQEKLRKRIILEKGFSKIRRIAGADISSYRNLNKSNSDRPLPFESRSGTAIGTRPIRPSLFGKGGCPQEDRARAQPLCERAGRVECLSGFPKRAIKFTRLRPTCPPKFQRRPEGRSRAYAAVVIFSFPELEILEEEYAIGSLSFPYIPGLLTFREGPLLLEAFKKVRSEPDIIIFDGQGIAHPKRLGLATHMGILLDKPTIGCAKSRLIGIYEEPEKKRGAYSLLKDGSEIIGAVLRTREDVSPVFVSPGHRIDLKSSIEMVSKCLRGHRLPEPTRQAHLLVNKLRAEDR